MNWITSLIVWIPLIMVQSFGKNVAQSTVLDFVTNALQLEDELSFEIESIQMNDGQDIGRIAEEISGLRRALQNMQDKNLNLESWTTNKLLFTSSTSASNSIRRAPQRIQSPIYSLAPPPTTINPNDIKPARVFRPVQPDYEKSSESTLYVVNTGKAHRPVYKFLPQHLLPRRVREQLESVSYEFPLSGQNDGPDFLDRLRNSLSERPNSEEQAAGRGNEIVVGISKPSFSTDPRLENLTTTVPLPDYYHYDKSADYGDSYEEASTETTAAPTTPATTTTTKLPTTATQVPMKKPRTLVYAKKFSATTPFSITSPTSSAQEVAANKTTPQKQLEKSKTTTKIQEPTLSKTTTTAAANLSTTPSSTTFKSATSSQGFSSTTPREKIPMPFLAFAEPKVTEHKMTSDLFQENLTNERNITRTVRLPNGHTHQITVHNNLAPNSGPSHQQILILYANDSRSFENALKNFLPSIRPRSYQTPNTTLLPETTRRPSTTTTSTTVPRTTTRQQTVTFTSAKPAVNLKPQYPIPSYDSYKGGLTYPPTSLTTLQPFERPYGGLTGETEQPQPSRFTSATRPVTGASTSASYGGPQPPYTIPAYKSLAIFHPVKVGWRKTIGHITALPPASNWQQQVRTPLVVQSGYRSPDNRVIPPASQNSPRLSAWQLAQTQLDAQQQHQWLQVTRPRNTRVPQPPSTRPPPDWLNEDDNERHVEKTTKSLKKRVTNKFQPSFARWTPWSPWSACSALKRRVRKRYCQRKNSGDKCQGRTLQMVRCNTKKD